MLLQCYFESYTLCHAVNAMVILPSDIGAFKNRSHNWNEKFPVLYLLHGGGSDYSAWLRFTNVERFANEHKIAVVLAHCPDMCYRRAHVSFPEMAWEGDKDFNYEAFITHELPDWASANFPISSDPKDSFIAGFSLGGYGAAYAAFSAPEKYAAVGLFSAYIFSPELFNGELRRSLSKAELREYLIPDLVEPILKSNKSGKKLPKVYITHGTREIEELDPVYADVLRENGAEVFEDYGDYPFGHEWQMWELAVKHFLEWIPRSDGFAKQ